MPIKKPPDLKSYLNVNHDFDWLRKAFILSSIGYTSTSETAVHHSDWLNRRFSHVIQNKAYISTNELYGTKFSCYVK